MNLRSNFRPKDYFVSRTMRCVMRQFFLLLTSLIAVSASAGQTQGAIKVHQLTTGGGSTPFTYNATYSSTPFSLTDTLINFSGNITSGDVTTPVKYTVNQTDLPPNWAVTDISCVCYQSNIPGNDPTKPCLSTTHTDIHNATLTVDLVGEELVECTFVDTFTPPTCQEAPCPVCGNGIVENGENCDLGSGNGANSGCSSTCIFEGEIVIHQISASGTSHSFSYQASYASSDITLTDGQIASSGFIPSFELYTIKQKPNNPTSWSVTNISCVCSQLPTPPNNQSAPCQSTWQTDIPNSRAIITLHGAEKVECTFVDTLNACTGSSCTPSCGNGVVDAGEQCDNGIHNSDTVFGPGECTTHCTFAPIPSPCAEKALELYDACHNNSQVPGGTSEASVMLMVLAALFWTLRRHRASAN